MRNRFKKIGIGVEIECIVNRDIIDFLNIGSYHDGRTLVNKNGRDVTSWDVETDSSINYGQNFDNGKGLEFVSDCFKSKREFFRGIDSFIKVFSVNGKYELKEVLEINESCGCHIHFSKGKRKFAKRVHSYFYKNTTKRFFELLKQSNLPPKVKASVKKQFYRNYAKKSSEKQFNLNRLSGMSSVRHSEWNFNSERSGCGLEWRSFNIRDVETWKDFKNLMSIAFTSLEPLILNLNNWKKGNLYNVCFEEQGQTEDKKKYQIRKMRRNSIKIVLPKRKNNSFLIKNRNTEYLFKKMENKEIKIENTIKQRILNILNSGSE